MSNNKGSFSASYMARHSAVQDTEVARKRRLVKKVTVNRSDAFDAEFNPQMQPTSITSNHRHQATQQPQAVLIKTMRNGKKVYTVKR